MLKLTQLGSGAKKKKKRSFVATVTGSWKTKAVPMGPIWMIGLGEIVPRRGFPYREIVSDDYNGTLSQHISFRLP